MRGNDSLKQVGVALAVGVIAAAGVARAADPGSKPSPEFAKLDGNRDGYVSRAEARKLDDFTNAFNDADDNGDGRLDEAEFAKAQSIQARLRAGQFVEDSVITAKVKAELLKDSLVKGLDVKVQTHKGTVLLSGFVATEQQAKRAAELAASVGGVLTVKNSLIVNG